MSYLEIISGVIILAANVFLALAYFLNLSKIKKELNEVKIVVKDTHEIREALRKPLEGTWMVSGVFELFQNSNETHYSTGYAILTWLPSKEQYEVKYMYSVRKEYDSLDIVTVFCSGYASADKCGVITEKYPLILNMVIESHSTINSMNPESKSFALTSTQLSKAEERINSIEFIFENKNTKGVINFSR